MGTSTNGQICYGYEFGECDEFPWDDERFEGEIDYWWVHVKGFDHTVDNPYTEYGDYKNGIQAGDSIVREYHEELRKWRNKNPTPVDLVNYCSCDCPMYILAIPSTIKKCSRGYPTEFNPFNLVPDDIEKIRFMEFFKEYGIERSDEPKWYLTSYWG